ncbi:MAG: hypothetical protein JSR37_05840 [Verrucomicrobia bacterium]|nr:hypothetical protein [Verrucomicrobiota bacterium]MBS0637443.1 hypothetical protein [Verrucomicrobiota bacterium]
MSVHECTFKSEIASPNVPSSKCLTTILECMEPKLYGPVTIGQCLRRMGHSEVCIKEATGDDVALFTRTVQTSFLQHTLPKAWSRSFAKMVINKLPKDAVEALRFLRDIENKDRGDNETPDYSTDRELFTACRTSDNAELIIESYDTALKTGDGDYIVLAFSSLLSTNEAAQQTIIEKTIAAIMDTTPSKISEHLCDYIAKALPEPLRQEWKLCTAILYENHRLLSQLKFESCFFLAYSCSKKSVIETEKLYGKLENFANSANPKDYWESIRSELKHEFAITFYCLLSKLIANPPNNQTKETYEEIQKEFMEKTVKSKSAKKAMEFMQNPAPLVTKAIQALTKETK